MANFKQTFPDTDLSFNMIHIEGGTFDMGSTQFKDSQPIHTVALSEFWICDMLVTQAIWAYVMSNNPSHFKGINRPVDNISWNNINDEKYGFLATLNRITEGLVYKNKTYRLPTETEWEYTARSGKHSSKYNFKYPSSNKLNSVGWYGENSHDETKPLGLKIPNLLGIYDLSGNVSEWCEDQWHIDYKGAPINNLSWSDRKTDNLRIRRGGSYFNIEERCNLTFRNFSSAPTQKNRIGFRLALSL